MPMRFSLHTVQILFVMSLLGLVRPEKSQAQEYLAESLDLFLDCRRCDTDYIRREIPYVNHVRDRQVAHVHLLITSQRTGSGGQNYQMNFIGLKQFSALTDTLFFISSNTDTNDEVRRGMTRVIAAGLMRYLARTSLANQLQISSTGQREGDPVTTNPEDDPWKSWVFNVGAEGEYEEEESQNEIRGSARLSAARVTEEWKIRMNFRANYREQKFDVGDRIITNTVESGNLWLFVAKSLGAHWSAGASSFTDTSTRRNTKLSSSIGPAIEYNIFPYSQSSEREIRVQYWMTVKRVEYEEITIFDKLQETLLSHRFEVRLDFRQPWGSANARFEASQFLTDFEESKTDFYNIELSGFINVRLVRGLSVNLGGGVEFVHDQLYLVKEEATEEEILLGTKQLPTDFQFDFRIGLNYSFGSIYNNVVNPRFGF